ncbi:hypothetical protein HYQ46_004443 [Verticillium longisporum]|nr:hypothetical protein HYQ46_004443 [Verticillium longisporum]
MDAKRREPSPHLLRQVRPHARSCSCSYAISAAVPQHLGDEHLLLRPVLLAAPLHAANLDGPQLVLGQQAALLDNLALGALHGALDAAVASRMPLHDDQALWRRVQGSEHVRVSQAGHLYLGGWMWQMAQSVVRRGSFDDEVEAAPEGPAAGVVAMLDAVFAGRGGGESEGPEVGKHPRG